MKHFPLLLFSLSFSCTLSAQTVSGVITDAETFLPVGYASAGIEGTAVGTVADKDGNYTLKLGPEHEADTVCFSHISYEPARVAVSELIAMPSAGVALEPAVYPIEDVVITPGKWRRRTMGNNFLTSIYSTGTWGGSPGFEYGPLFKFRKRARIESIEISVRNCTFERMVFRINVYKQAPDGNGFVNILAKPIYSHIDRTLYSESGMTSIVVDVSGHNIVAEGNTLVTLEYIEAGRQGEVTFPIGFIGNACYSRNSSQDVWEKQVMKFPIKVTAMVER